MIKTTMLWLDYETFGLDTKRDRPAQFAAIRTDEDLNEVGEPQMIYCQVAPDYLPHPMACLTTGITPRLCNEKGLVEAEFSRVVEKMLSEPGTVGVGYNTIKYDDEITRFMFWRNLQDPYAREWKNGCGRWDILDVVRATYALRPQGINWPLKPDGRPSFKLEDLTKANGLVHEAAHDALSDVRATIGMARLIKQKQPRLFDFCFALRQKDRAAREVMTPHAGAQARPFIHVSGSYKAENGCMKILLPLFSHPTNRNEIICWDLSQDPMQLADMDAQSIRQRLFVRAKDLPEGVTRLGIDSVSLNKSPMVFSDLRVLSQEQAARWGIDVQACLANAEKAQGLPEMSGIWAEVYHREPMAPLDVDADLYSGFLSNEDRRRLDRLNRLSAQELALDRTGFDDQRLPEMVFRYRARNYPHTLSEQEQARWAEFKAARLLKGDGGGLSISSFQLEAAKAHEFLGESITAQKKSVLDEISAYASALQAQLSPA